MFGLKYNDSLALKIYINKEIEKKQIRKQSGAKKTEKNKESEAVVNQFFKSSKCSIRT